MPKTVQFWLHPQGSDSDPGTLEKPLATLKETISRLPPDAFLAEGRLGYDAKEVKDKTHYEIFLDERVVPSTPTDDSYLRTYYTDLETEKKFARAWTTRRVGGYTNEIGDFTALIHDDAKGVIGNPNLDLRPHDCMRECRKSSPPIVGSLRRTGHDAYVTIIDGPGKGFRSRLIMRNTVDRFYLSHPFEIQLPGICLTTNTMFRLARKSIIIEFNPPLGRT